MTLSPCRSDAWIETASGLRWSPQDPGNFAFSDLALGISRICRYSGQLADGVPFYCPTEEQLVLTGDLQWVPAGELMVGDTLVGFDENPVLSGGVARRGFRAAKVLTATRIRRRIVRLEMSDGSTVRASEEHPWLTRTLGSGNQVWRTSSEIVERINCGSKTFINRFIDPWPRLEDRAAGWLAGIFDGEGSLSYTARRRGGLLSISQNPGLVLEEIISSLAKYGFSHSKLMASGDQKYSVLSLQIAGGWREHLRLLGSVRPIRLVDKFFRMLESGNFARRMDSPNAPLEIVRAYDEGWEWVAGLETSTRTYLCEGFGAHNSVAEHSVLMHDFAYQKVPGLTAGDLVAILFHDLHEGILGDVPSPLKPLMPGYVELEETMGRIVAQRYGGTWPAPPIVKELDRRILVDERRGLLNPSGNQWGTDGLEPLGVRFKMLYPPDALELFLERASLYLGNGAWVVHQWVGQSDRHPQSNYHR